MSENTDGFWAGGLSGAATGAGIGAAIGAPAGGVGAVPGAAIGAVIGFIGGGIMGNQTADASRRLRVDAEKKAEAARRASIVKQMGAQQQAEGIAFAALSSKSSTGKSATGSPEKPGGLMGQNLTTSGTF